MGIKVGIDLGTTYCAVATMDPSKNQPYIIRNTNDENIVPSFIQFVDGKTIVGKEAQEAFEAKESGCVCAFKLNMGHHEEKYYLNDNEYSAYELSAILLKYLKDETEASTGQKIDEAVITCPAYFADPERRDIFEAAKLAGLNVKKIIDEPTAAALCFGTNHWKENNVVLVYDLGGGTFDITLIQLQGTNNLRTVATLGDHRLGGKDWDNELVNIISGKILSDTGIDPYEDLSLQSLIMRSAELIKKKLTDVTTAKVDIYIPDYGPYETTVTRDEFNESTRYLIDRTGMLCDQLLQKEGLNWSNINDVLLVGGSTKMRQVREYLKEKTGKTPLSAVNPDEAVALGAAIQSSLQKAKYLTLGGTDDTKRSGNNSLKFGQAVGKETRISNAAMIEHNDIIAHSMGIIAVNAEGTHYINKTIIPANEVIPCKRAKEFNFYTSKNQEDNEIEIYVLQGDKAPLDPDTRIIHRYIVSGIIHDRANNPTTIRVQYSYDNNGLVHVQARQGSGTKDLPIREEPIPADMSKYGRPVEKVVITKKPDLNILMAIDVSGSMGGNPIADAKRAMVNFVDQFSDYDGDIRIGVIANANSAVFVSQLTSDFTSLKSEISLIDCNYKGVGYGSSGQPFDLIYDCMKDCYDSKNIAIVLADGQWGYADQSIQKAKKCHSANIDVIGIGFGDADKQFMNAISSGDISSVMLGGSSELVSGFGKIAQEISNGNGGKTSTQNNGSGKQSTGLTWKAINED